MLSEELWAKLHKLNRTDKLHVVQVLVNELATEEDVILSAEREYEVWSPYDSAATARQLRELLEKDKRG